VSDQDDDILRRQTRELAKLVGLMQLMDFKHTYTDDDGVEHFGTPMERMIAKVPDYRAMFIEYCIRRQLEIMGDPPKRELH
jgi:hypothetical protein